MSEVGVGCRPQSLSSSLIEAGFLTDLELTWLIYLASLLQELLVNTSLLSIGIVGGYPFCPDFACILRSELLYPLSHQSRPLIYMFLLYSIDFSTLFPLLFVSRNLILLLSSLVTTGLCIFCNIIHICFLFLFT